MAIAHRTTMEIQKLKNKGFSLIELMFVLAIIGVLATIAVPSFQDTMRAGKRSDAIAATLSLQLAQEKFRGNCALYADTLGGAANSCADQTITHDSTSKEKYYVLKMSVVSGNGYKITATPQGTQAHDSDCNPMQLTINPENPDGLKEPEGCWD